MTTRDSESEAVWIGLGTRLSMLVYKPRRNVWQIWTATNSRMGDSDLWLGTYLEVYNCGMCTQHYRSETEQRQLIIRGCRYGGCHRCGS